MKAKILLTLIAGAMTIAAAAAEWKTDLDQALKDAKKKDHAVLLLFSGTDWCPPCMRLHKDVLSSKEFTDYADKNLELVLAAFPRKTSLPADQAKKNRKLAAKYGIEGFPTAILLDADGKQLDKMVGGVPLEYFMNFLKKNIKEGGKETDSKTHKVSLKKGESITITLPENATTGYQWIAKYDKELCSVTLDHCGPETKSKNGQMICGAPGSVKVTMKLLTDKQAEVKMLYQRSWEKNVPPAEEETYLLTVQ